VTAPKLRCDIKEIEIMAKSRKTSTPEAAQGSGKTHRGTGRPRRRHNAAMTVGISPAITAGASATTPAEDAATTTVADPATTAAPSVDPATTATGPADAPVTRSSKKSTVLTLLKRPEGAAISDLTAVTGWQEHSVRAMLTGFRKEGKQLVRNKNSTGITHYRLAEGVR
jgi:hypothetical protein